MPSSKGFLRCTFLPLCLVAATAAVPGQTKPEIAGDYVGTLGPPHLRLHLHLELDASGTLVGTVDSPNQGASGLACANFKLDGESLSFSVPSVHGKWKGTISADAKTLTGTWDQGNPMRLVFTRHTFAPADRPSRVDGIWLGTLHAGDMLLRVQVHVRSDKGGKEYCSLDSLDQHAMELDCADVRFSGDNFAFDVPFVKGFFAGKLSTDGNALTGIWSQHGNFLPLKLTRQKEEIAARLVPSPAFGPAMAPVDASRILQIADHDRITDK